MSDTGWTSRGGQTRDYGDGWHGRVIGGSPWYFELTHGLHDKVTLPGEESTCDRVHEFLAGLAQGPAQPKRKRGQDLIDAVTDYMKAATEAVREEGLRHAPVAGKPCDGCAFMDEHRCLRFPPTPYLRATPDYPYPHEQDFMFAPAGTRCGEYRPTTEAP